MKTEDRLLLVSHIFYLASCAIHGRKAEMERIQTMDLPRVLGMAKWNSLEAIVSMALEEAGLKSEETAAAIGNSQRRSLLMDLETAQILGKLEEAGIPHAPLKGMVLKSCYPRLGMREMSDCDILFDPSRAEDVRQMMGNLGFQTIKFNRGTTDVYFKEPVINIEMHRSLFYPHREQLYAYYKDPLARMVRQKDSCRFAFSPEDFYVYLLAHAYKHYSLAGTGLRILADVYVYRHWGGHKLDDAYLEAECAKIELGDFPSLVKSTSEKLFAGETFTEEEKDFLIYLLESGSYGTMKHRVAKIVSENGGGFKGKLNYIRTRLFMPSDVIKVSFPFFYKHKWLYPFLPLYRVCRNMKKARYELAMVLGIKEGKNQSEE